VGFFGFVFFFFLQTEATTERENLIRTFNSLAEQRHDSNIHLQRMK